MKTFNEAPPLLKDFLIHMEVIRGKSEKTTNEYYLDLRTFLRYLKCHLGKADFRDFDNINISDITADDLKTVTLSTLYEYMYFVTKERKNNYNARARKVSSLRSFFKYLTTKAGILADNPAKELDSPKIPDLLPKYLTLEESKNLLSSINGEFQKRDYAIITLFLNCGMRLSELVGINISNYKDDKLTVIGKGGKERTIYLNSACRNAIDEYLKIRPHEHVKDRDAMFLSKRRTRISSKMVQVIVKKSLATAGLDTNKYSVHKLRHTAATLMYKYGDVDIRALQEILGHKHLSTTEIYTHVDDDRLREAAEKNPLSDITPD